ncbi:MAG: invasion associated locus B family protein [Rhodoferax sp.]|nr:invasion associated locus B family protein [Pseudorhodobacter sp.]
MTKLTHTLAMLLCLAAPSISYAQEAAAPVDPATTTEAPVAATGTDLSLGTEVGGNTGPGSTYVAAAFESWEQRCVRAPEGGVDTCQLYQLLKDEKGNSVAEITLFGLPEGQAAAAGATVIAPLETLLTEGLLLQIDTGKAKSYPFTWCSSIGCIARIGLTSAEVDALKKGNKATLTIVPVVAPTDKVLLDVSLKGFTAGFTAVNDANAKADAAGKAAAPAPAP